MPTRIQKASCENLLIKIQVRIYDAFFGGAKRFRKNTTIATNYG
jgi:hypothetical protein